MRLVLTIVIGLAALALAACGATTPSATPTDSGVGAGTGTQTSEAVDMAVYSSIEQLSDASDLAACPSNTVCEVLRV